MVFELLIPDGPVPTEMPERRNPYANMAAIALVNKEFSSQVYTVMYQTASRRCIVHVEHGYAMRMVGKEFNLSLCPSPLPAMEWRPMYEMHGVGKFSHYDVRFAISLGNWNRSNILHLIPAISEPRVATSMHRSRCPEINIEFEPASCIVGDYGVVRYDDEWIKSIISGIQSVLAVAASFRVKLKWTVELVVHCELSCNTAVLLLSATSMKVTEGTITSDLRWAVRRILEEFESIRIYAWAQQTATYALSLMTTWRQFNDCYRTLRGLVEVGHVVVDDFEDDPEYFKCEFSTAAKAGLEEGTELSTAALLRYINTARDTYVAHHQHNIDALQQGHSQNTSGTSYSMSPLNILQPPPRPRLLSKFVKGYRSKEEKEKTQHRWLEKLERSRIKVGMSKKDYYRSNYRYRRDYVKLHDVYKQCAHAAAKVKKGQSLLPFTKTEAAQS